MTHRVPLLSEAPHIIAKFWLVFGVVTSGSESDLQTCTGIARSMVGRWGMSDRVGPMSVFQPDADPRMSGVAEATLDAVDQEVRRLVEESYKRAIELLTENRKRLDRIAAKLLERETLDEAEVYAAAGLPHGGPAETKLQPRPEPISLPA
jgi:cell division protease FtsH